MNTPSTGAVVAIALGAACAALLLGGLVITARIMRHITRRLTALHASLVALGVVSDPLPDRVAGITGNVRTLREAAFSLSQLVSSRTGAADVRH